MKSVTLLWTRAFTLKFALASLAHGLCLYACLALTLNSRWSYSIFDQLVNPMFSGKIMWSRTVWGPAPWDLTVKDLKLIDAQDKEVISAHTFLVRDYDLAGLFNDTYGARYLKVERAQVRLKSRPHSEDPQRLIWDIAELFLKPGHLNEFKDGSPAPPILVHVDEVDLIHVDTLVEMGVTRVKAHGASITGGFFELDLTRDLMRINAQNARVQSVNTQVFLRDNTLDMSSFERAQAPILKTLDYQGSDIVSRDFWWIGDQFGGSELKLKLYQTDTIHLLSWVLDMSKLGVPHGRAQVSAQLDAIDRYLAPWALDILRGEMKLEGYIHGPLDNPSARNATIEGQLFLAQLGSARFQFNGSKSRHDLVALTRGRLWSKFGDLGVRGTLDLKSLLGQVKLTAHELIWAKATPLRGSWRIWEKSATGEVSLKLRPHLRDPFRERDLDEPDLSWILGVEADLEIQGPKLVHLFGRATVTTNEVRLHKGEFTLNKARRSSRRNHDLRLQAQGRVDLKRRQIRGKLELSGHIKPRSLPPLKLPLSGHLELKFDINGSLTRPYISGSVDARRLKSSQWGYPWNIKHLRSRFSLHKNTLKLRSSVVELPRDHGRLSLELTLPLQEPSAITGWIDVEQVELDLNPLKFPFSSRLDGLMCTLDAQGCARYYAHRAEASKRAERLRGIRRRGESGLPRCIERLGEALQEESSERERASRGAQTTLQAGGAVCLTLNRPTLEGRRIDPLDLKASARPQAIQAVLQSDALEVKFVSELERAWDISRARAEVDLKLYLDALSSLIPNNSLSLEALKGRAEAHLSLRSEEVTSSFKRYKTRVPWEVWGGGHLKLWRVSAPLSGLMSPPDLNRDERPRDERPRERSSRKSDQVTQPPVLGFDTARFELTLEPDIVSAVGELGGALKLGGAYRFSSSELTAYAKLKALQLTTLALSASPQSVSVRALRREVQSSLPKLQRSDTPPLSDKIAPLILSDATGRVLAFTLDSRQSCRWANQPLASSQTTRISIDEARVDLSLLLKKTHSTPYLRARLDNLRVDYWGRESSGDLLKLPRGDAGVETRGELCDRHLPDAEQPTASFVVSGAPQIELSGRDAFSEHIRVNPSRARPTTQTPTETPVEPQDLSQPSICLSQKLSLSGGQVLYLNPIQIEHQARRLSLRLGINRGHVDGCLAGDIDLSLFTFFLRSYFQTTRGMLRLKTKLTGPITELQVSGEAQLKRAQLTQPRLKLIGDLVVDTALLKLNSLRGGGVQIKLVPHQASTLRRNDEVINIEDLLIDLPRFLPRRLNIGFSSPRVALTLPPTLRSALKLRKMRFEMDFPDTDQAYVSRAEKRWAPPKVGVLSRRKRAKRTRSQETHSVKEARLRSDTERLDLPTLKLSGDILVLNALYRAQFLSLNEILSQNSINSLRGRAEISSLSIFETSPILKNLKIDLHIEGNDEIHIETQVADITDFDLEVELDLTLKGRLFSRPEDPPEERLSLRGEIETLNGSILSISKHPFTISQAQITLGGSSIVSDQSAQVSDFLSAELTAQHTFNITPPQDQTYQTNFDQQFSNELVAEEVTLTGQLKMKRSDSPLKLNFDFVSQSGRDRFEVIHLILFGRYPEGPTRNNNPQNTGELLVSQTFSLLERPLANTFGLDKLTIDPSFTPNNKSLSVNLNKVFSRRLRFSLNAMFAETDVNQSQSFLVEYRLNSIISGEVSFERRNSEPASGRARLRLRLGWD